MVRITVNVINSYEYELNDSLLEYLKEQGVNIKKLGEVEDFIATYGTDFDNNLINYAGVCDEVNVSMTIDKE